MGAQQSKESQVFLPATPTEFSASLINKLDSSVEVCFSLFAWFNSVDNANPHPYSLTTPARSTQKSTSRTLSPRS